LSADDPDVAADDGSGNAVPGAIASGGSVDDDYTQLTGPVDGVPDNYVGAITFDATGTIVPANTPGAITGYLVDVPGSASANGYENGADFLLYVPTGTSVVPPTFSTSNVNVSAVFHPVCLAEGTMVATPAGDRAVESLAAGDLVLTAAGVARPVRWLGRSTHARRFADPARVFPIRIKAGALGENLPVRDLLVSPAHAVLIGDVLVQAAAMVNGTSILQETALPDVFTYYHVELDGHDLLVTEGVATESLLICSESLRFDNIAERPADLGMQAELPHARVKAPRQLPAAIAALLRNRADALMAELDIAA
jgi:hypothetical protein